MALATSRANQPSLASGIDRDEVPVLRLVPASTGKKTRSRLSGELTYRLVFLASATQAIPSHSEARQIFPQPIGIVRLRLR